jgi:hypothetical protein
MWLNRSNQEAAHRGSQLILSLLSPERQDKVPSDQVTYAHAKVGGTSGLKANENGEAVGQSQLGRKFWVAWKKRERPIVLEAFLNGANRSAQVDISTRERYITYMPTKISKHLD